MKSVSAVTTALIAFTFCASGLFSLSSAHAASDFAEPVSGSALDLDDKGHDLLQINGALAFELFDRLEAKAQPAHDLSVATEKIGRDLRCVKMKDWAFCEMRLDTRRGKIFRQN